MRDVVSRMHGRPLVRNEPKESVLGWDTFQTGNRSGGGSGRVRSWGRVLACVIRVVEEPLNGSFGVPGLQLRIIKRKLI